MTSFGYVVLATIIAFGFFLVLGWVEDLIIARSKALGGESPPLRAPCWECEQKEAEGFLDDVPLCSACARLHQAEGVDRG